ncbi:MAG: ethanolamine utilization protein EutM [Epulopiscium sp.]|jgi:microcompartment protein CcmL/EutN|uniref:BMC domain-containing protein n=1 Tax=Defluviitalea raffinosedens TaxID=1450156 RepID=UPI001D8100BC|nr:microcompartment protein CcmL/EutN [Defluviitalea raffinosedens]MBZ4667256.1 microcompartment protein [Defluviitaleaceae bacterium]MDK2788011.1 ethanolamine utilization protein EutM [Candidatus Epulonipiscium sp.]
MAKYNFSAIGIVEISFYVNALTVLDEMLKTAEVHLIHWEKKLGGRLVTIIVGGDTSAVQSAIDVAKSMGQVVGEKNIKVAITIPSPHPEIIKLIYKEREKRYGENQGEIKQEEEERQNCLQENNDKAIETEVRQKRMDQEKESNVETIEEKPKKRSRRKKDEGNRNDRN